MSEVGDYIGPTILIFEIGGGNTVQPGELMKTGGKELDIRQIIIFSQSQF
jgi:hypothetical protein